MKKSSIATGSLAITTGTGAAALMHTEMAGATAATHMRFSVLDTQQIVITIVTGALVVAAGILWFLSFHRKRKNITKQYEGSAAAKKSTRKPAKKSVTSTAKAGAKTVKTSAKAATSKSSARSNAGRSNARKSAPVRARSSR